MSSKSLWFRSNFAYRKIVSVVFFANVSWFFVLRLWGVAFNGFSGSHLGNFVKLFKLHLFVSLTKPFRFSLSLSLSPFFFQFGFSLSNVSGLNTLCWFWTKSSRDRLWIKAWNLKLDYPQHPKHILTTLFYFNIIFINHETSAWAPGP